MNFSYFSPYLLTTTDVYFYEGEVIIGIIDMDDERLSGIGSVTDTTLVVSLIVCSGDARVHVSVLVLIVVVIVAAVTSVCVVKAAGAAASASSLALPSEAAIVCSSCVAGRKRRACAQGDRTYTCSRLPP